MEYCVHQPKRCHNLPYVLKVKWKMTYRESLFIIVKCSAVMDELWFLMHPRSQSSSSFPGHIIGVTWPFVPLSGPYGGQWLKLSRSTSPLQHFACLTLNGLLCTIQMDLDKILNALVLVMFNQSLVTNLWGLTTQ